MKRLEGVVYHSAQEAKRWLDCDAWLPLTAGEALRDAAQRVPAKIALVDDETRLSFAQFDEESERLGAALLKAGLDPGDRVIFQMATASETAVAVFACMKAGLIPVCALPQHRDLEIGFLAGLTRARGYIVQADMGSFDLAGFARTMRKAHSAIEILVIARGPAGPGDLSMKQLIDAQDLAEARALLAEITIAPTDVAMLQLSGGTTGVPKVIPRFHGEYLGYAAAWANFFGLTEEDVGLWALPLIHNAAMIYYLLPSVLQARTLVLMGRFEARRFFETIEREGVTATGSIGPIAAHILDYKDIGQHDLSRLRLFHTLARADAMEAHTGIGMMLVFGITEGVLTGAPLDASVAVRHTTAGRPVSPFDEFRLLHPGTEDAVPPGASGELCFRGPSTLRGYYRNPEANATAFTSDGFFRTGDLMRAHDLDGGPWYSFEGRIKDNIDRGGEKFGTEDIEALLARHPALADARVVAMPDRVYGEKACAYLVLRPGAACPTLAEIGAFLLGHGLAKFKLPERLEQIESLPVTRVGKVDKAALRALIAAKIAAEETGS